MKEFVLKHPIITFFLVEEALTVLNNLVKAIGIKKKEADADESSGDNQ